MNDLTIIIPVKDTKPQYLKAAVESIIKQNNCELEVEVIIVDDHSTSEATLSGIAELNKTSAVTVLLNNHAGGVSGARNAGLEASTSRWVGFLDSDDWWTKKALLYFSQITRKYPEARFIAGDAIIHTQNRPVYWNYRNPRAGRFSEKLVEARENREILELDSGSAVEFILQYSILISPGMAIIRRDVFDMVGVFDENLARGEDVNLWLRIARVYPLYFMPGALLNYRKHDEGVTWGKPPGAGNQEFLPAFLKDPQWEPWYGTIRARLCKSHINSCYFFQGKGMWIDSIHHSMKAIKYCPLRVGPWKRLVGALIRRS